MQIIPVASGKGGVGKSLLSANLAVALSQAGKRVVLADLDLGASNLHLVLGQPSPKNGLGTWLMEGGNFLDVIAPTEYENLKFIAGDSEIPGLTALKAPQRTRLVKNFKSIDADYLIIDLGAGTHQIILDLFLLSPQGIVVSAPATTAILNGYLFLKNTVFRLLNSSFKPGSAAAKHAMQAVFAPRRGFRGCPPLGERVAKACASRRRLKRGEDFPLPNKTNPPYSSIAPLSADETSFA